MLDYLFDCNGKEHWLELKSAALRADSRYALYPDCSTIRGRKHLKDLTNLSSQGSSATVVFVAALSGVDAFRPNPNGDLQIPHLLQKALKAGVAIRAISVCYEPETSTVYLDNPDLKVELNY